MTGTFIYPVPSSGTYRITLSKTAPYYTIQPDYYYAAYPAVLNCPSRMRCTISTRSSSSVFNVTISCMVTFTLNTYDSITERQYNANKDT
jgi:hypothetical protein